MVGLLLEDSVAVARCRCTGGMPPRPNPHRRLHGREAVCDLSRHRKKVQGAGKLLEVCLNIGMLQQSTTASVSTPCEATAQRSRHVTLQCREYLKLGVSGVRDHDEHQDSRVLGAQASKLEEQRLELLRWLEALHAWNTHRSRIPAHAFG